MTKRMAFRMLAFPVFHTSIDVDPLNGRQAQVPPARLHCM
jgi:hypothetical protein